jgi:TPR repeat protein
VNLGYPRAQQALAQLGNEGLKPVPGIDLWNQAIAKYRAGDHGGAADLVEKAAKAGNPTAVYQMGYIYEKGDGRPKNLSLSAKWYFKGAAMGEPRSEAAVGQFYEQGEGVRDDWVEAAKWYMKSAAQGAKMGEADLARAYQFGIGVPLDLNEAASWYDRAAAQGDSNAAYFAQYIRNNHGFDGTSYSPEEQAIMAPYRMQPWALRMPPFGRVFHNTAERMAYFQAWARAAQAYQTCMAAHFNALPGARFTCPAPEPPS